jgi:hypothetical protein
MLKVLVDQLSRFVYLCTYLFTCVFIYLFETRSCYVAWAGPKFMILLIQPLWYWICKHALPPLTLFNSIMENFKNTKAEKPL